MLATPGPQDAPVGGTQVDADCWCAHVCLLVWLCFIAYLSKVEWCAADLCVELWWEPVLSSGKRRRAQECSRMYGSSLRLQNRGLRCKPGVVSAPRFAPWPWFSALPHVDEIGVHGWPADIRVCNSCGLFAAWLAHSLQRVVTTTDIRALRTAWWSPSDPSFRALSLSPSLLHSLPTLRIQSLTTSSTEGVLLLLQDRLHLLPGGCAGHGSFLLNTHSSSRSCAHTSCASGCFMG